MNVAQVNVTQPPDWAPTAEQVAQLKAAMNREAYPPARREGVGTVLRRTS